MLANNLYLVLHASCQVYTLGIEKKDFKTSAFGQEQEGAVSCALGSQHQVVEH